MSNLQTARKRFQTALTIFGVADLVLLAYLLWPGLSVSSRAAEEHRLKEQHAALNRDVAPLRNIDKTLLQTRSDITTLTRERIFGQFSQISQEVEKLVGETGVSPQAIHYDPEKSDKGELPGIQRIGIDTTITGDYSKVARFVNALEKDKMFFVINKIALSSHEGGQVSLQIKFETFLRQAVQTGGA